MLRSHANTLRADSASKPARGSSLLCRLVTLMLIGVGVPLMLVVYLSASSANKSLVQQWNILQTQVGQSVSSLVSTHIQACIQQMAVLDAGLRDSSGRMEMQTVLAGKANIAFTSFLKAGGVLRLEIRDTHGHVTHAGYSFVDQAPIDLIESTYTATLDSDRPIVSRPVFSAKLSEFLFMIGMPVLNGDYREGVLLGVFSLDPALHSIREGDWSGIRVFIVDRDGKLAAKLDRDGMPENLDYSQNEVVKYLLTNVRELGAVTRRFVESQGQDKLSMIGTGVLIPETGWVVIAAIPESEAHAEARAKVRNIMMLSIGALIISMAVSALYFQKLIRPLRQLAESARHLVSGNYSLEIPTDDTSEVGAVAQAFKEMARQVRQNLAHLNLAVEDSRQLFTGIIRALASAIDAKDPYTRGHSERVTRFAVEIAKLMELPEEEIERIKLGALIHDVGKISVDDRILKKPGALSDDEFRVMKTHTTRGYEMMKHIPQLNDILPGMYSHHEQMDGKGYPKGLKGDEIPMIARVIMVADCFDAMTTKRPYQDPAPIDQVLGMIRSFAGKRYDEQVVEALVRGVKTGQIIPHTAA